MSRSGVVRLRLECRSEEQTCAGRVTLRPAGALRSKRGKRLGKLSFGSAQFSIPAVTARTVKVKLPRKAHRVVLRLRRVKLRASVVPQVTQDTPTASRTVTVKRPRARSR